MSRQHHLDASNVVGYLRDTGLSLPAGTLRVETCREEGNINWVRRVRTEDGESSWVVKQARPALERFPEYTVSTERIVFEARYYDLTRPFDQESVCPEVLIFDPDHRVLVLEDLGDPPSLRDALADDAGWRQPVRTLAAFLGRVHSATRDPELAQRFENEEMKRLHGEHIFRLPYRPNDFPLPERVRMRARELWEDRALVETIDRAYERYLEPRGALVHGDVQSGNVLLPPGGVKLLDAEISHVGDPAFDLGVLLAHLRLGTLAREGSDGIRTEVATAWSAYAGAHGEAGLCHFADAARYAGIELLRRSIGAARDPAVEEEEGALAAIEAGLRLVRHPPEEPGDLA